MQFPAISLRGAIGTAGTQMIPCRSGSFAVHLVRVRVLSEYMGFITGIKMGTLIAYYS
jgi:hypothetical protein